jgi:hypothetical protein
MTKRGKQARLGDELERLVGRLDKKGGGGLRGVRVAAAWKKVSGPMVEAHSTGAHLRDRTLVVFVDTPIWASELSAMAEHYRQAVNSELGEESVKAVRFTVSRKVEEQRTHDAQDAPVRANPDVPTDRDVEGQKGL